MSRALAVVLLTGIYLLALGRAAVEDVALGAALSALVLLTVRRWVTFGEGVAPRELLRRMAAFVPYAGVLLAGILRSTWDTALRVLHVRPVDSAMVELDMGERSDLGVAIAAIALTLAPGSVLVSLDWDRRVMRVHILDASDPDGFRAEQDRLYERWQRRVFP